MYLRKYGTLHREHLYFAQKWNKRDIKGAHNLEMLTNEFVIPVQLTIIFMLSGVKKTEQVEHCHATNCISLSDSDSLFQGIKYGFN